MSVHFCKWVWRSDGEDGKSGSLLCKGEQWHLTNVRLTSSQNLQICFLTWFKEFWAAMIIKLRLEGSFNDPDGPTVTTRGLRRKRQDTAAREGLPSGSVLWLPATLGVTGLITGLGRSYMPQSNKAWAPQLLESCLWSSALRNKRNHRSEKPVHCQEALPKTNK